MHDHTDFRRQFPVVADHVLIKLILELTTTNPFESIAQSISGDLSALGYRCDDDELLELVGDMHYVIRKEVGAI